MVGFVPDFPVEHLVPIARDHRHDPAVERMPRHDQPELEFRELAALLRHEVRRRDEESRRHRLCGRRGAVGSGGRGPGAAGGHGFLLAWRIREIDYY